MPISLKELQAIWEHGTEVQCVEFFSGASETDRESLGKACEKRLRETSKFDFNLDVATPQADPQRILSIQKHAFEHRLSRAERWAAIAAECVNESVSGMNLKRPPEG